MRRIDDTIDYLSERQATLRPVVAVLAMVGLRGLARLGLMGMGAIWLVGQIRQMDQERAAERDIANDDNEVETADEDSFPASDPPSYTATTAGSPDESNGFSGEDRPELLN